MTLLELLALAATVGLLAGAAFGAFDVFHHGDHLSPRDVLIALSLAAVPAVPAVVLVAAMLAMVFALLRKQPSRQSWIGLLLSVAVVGLAAAVVLVGTQDHRDWVGLVLLLGSFPIAALAHGLVMKHSWLRKPGRAIVVGLSALQALIIVVCGIATVRVRGLHWIVSCAALAFTIVAFLWTKRQIPRLPVRTGLALLICLPLTMILFAKFGHPRVAIPFSTTRGNADKPPNVVLIVLDTTRRDYLGCYGHPGGLTPELDRIAAEGVVYEQAISAAPWTAPSHASMFTGLYPVTHGCSYEHHKWLDDDFPTLAEMLRSEGYQTIALNSNVAMALNNLLQGFDVNVSLSGPYNELALQKLSWIIGSPENWVDKGSAEGSEALMGWLTEVYDPESPFFLFVNLYEAHDPYCPPRAERRAHLAHNISYMEATRLALGFKPVVMHINGKPSPYAQKIIKGLYQAEVRYQDRRLGGILHLLREYTDFDNTLLFITADHGENIGEGGRWGHLQAINDILIHVPLIIRYRERFPPGKRMSGLCQTLDLLPTIYDVLATDCPVPGLPGRSLVPDHFVPRESAFAQVSPFYALMETVERTLGVQTGPLRFNAQLRVLRTDTFKYIWSSEGRHRLYDVARDPLETTDLIAQMPELVKKLHGDLVDWFASQPAYVPRGDDHKPHPLDDKTIEKLRSLGYIDD